MSRENLYLIGLSGVGKSTLGKRAALRLGMSYADLDYVLEEWEGLSIPEIFREKGEGYFRRREAEVLAWSAGQRHWVFATGGGVVTQEANIPLMRQAGWVVFLDRPVKEILEDMERATDRPMLCGDKETLYSLREARLPLYQKAGDICVQNGGAKSAALEAIVKWYREKITHEKNI
jgi:shikimate kinase